MLLGEFRQAAEVKITLMQRWHVLQAGNLEAARIEVRVERSSKADRSLRVAVATLRDYMVNRDSAAASESYARRSRERRP